MKINGVVLAGGLSRRMDHREKSLIELGGQPLVQHVVTRLHRQVSDLAINANGDPARFDFLNLPIIADPIEGNAGPLSGILAGLNWAARDPTITHIVSVASDTPFYPENFVAHLANALPDPAGDAIALASTNDRLHPVFGLWPVCIRQSLEDFLLRGETRKVLAFVDLHRLVDVPFVGQSHDPFFNINTADDLRIAETILQGA